MALVNQQGSTAVNVKHIILQKIIKIIFYFHLNTIILSTRSVLMVGSSWVIVIRLSNNRVSNELTEDAFTRHICVLCILYVYAYNTCNVIRCDRIKYIKYSRNVKVISRYLINPRKDNLFKRVRVRFVIW
jgi:hypothetical protein